MEIEDPVVNGIKEFRITHATPSSNIVDIAYAEGTSLFYDDISDTNNNGRTLHAIYDVQSDWTTQTKVFTDAEATALKADDAGTYPPLDPNGGYINASEKPNSSASLQEALEFGGVALVGGFEVTPPIDNNLVTEHLYYYTNYPGFQANTPGTSIPGIGKNLISHRQREIEIDFASIFNVDANTDYIIEITLNDVDHFNNPASSGTLSVSRDSNGELFTLEEIKVFVNDSDIGSIIQTKDKGVGQNRSQQFVVKSGTEGELLVELSLPFIFTSVQLATDTIRFGGGSSQVATQQGVRVHSVSLIKTSTLNQIGEVLNLDINTSHPETNITTTLATDGNNITTPFEYIILSDGLHDSQQNKTTIDLALKFPTAGYLINGSDATAAMHDRMGLGIRKDKDSITDFTTNKIKNNDTTHTIASLQPGQSSGMGQLTRPIGLQNITPLKAGGQTFTSVKGYTTTGAAGIRLVNVNVTANADGSHPAYDADNAIQFNNTYLACFMKVVDSINIIPGLTSNSKITSIEVVEGSTGETDLIILFDKLDSNNPIVLDSDINLSGSLSFTHSDNVIYVPGPFTSALGQYLAEKSGSEVIKSYKISELMSVTDSKLHSSYFAVLLDVNLSSANIQLNYLENFTISIDGDVASNNKKGDIMITDISPKISSTTQNLKQAHGLNTGDKITIASKSSENIVNSPTLSNSVTSTYSISEISEDGKQVTLDLNNVKNTIITGLTAKTDVTFIPQGNNSLTRRKLILANALSEQQASSTKALIGSKSVITSRDNSATVSDKINNFTRQILPTSQTAMDLEFQIASIANEANEMMEITLTSVGPFNGFNKSHKVGLKVTDAKLKVTMNNVLHNSNPQLSILCRGLPRGDPEIAGMLYIDDNGFLKVSPGVVFQ